MDVGKILTPSDSKGNGRGLEYKRFSIVLTPSDDPKLEETDKSERVINWQEP